MKVQATVLWVVLLGAGAGAAAAPARDPVGAQWLFREGRELMKKGELAAACPKLEESLRLDPAVGTLMNLAECEERQGRSASAWQRWAAAADELPPNDRRRATALARARSLEATLARLLVTVEEGAPADLVIERDGVVLGPASLATPMPVDPGLHVIVVSAPGRQRRTYEITADSGQLRAVAVAPGPPAAASLFSLDGAAAPPGTAPGTAGLVATSASTAPARPGRRLGWGLVAAGGAALAAGTYFGLQALSARDEADRACASGGAANRCWATANQSLDRDRRWSVAADVAFVSGALAAGAGLYLLLRRGPGEATATAQLVPMPSGGGAQLAGRF